MKIHAVITINGQESTITFDSFPKAQRYLCELVKLSKTTMNESPNPNYFKFSILKEVELKTPIPPVIEESPIIEIPAPETVTPVMEEILF